MRLVAPVPRSEGAIRTIEASAGPIGRFRDVLELPQALVDDIVAYAVQSYPYEACGLLAGPAGSGAVARFHRCRNAAGSARVYTVDPLDHLRAEREAEANGHEIIGVLHSH